MQVRAHQRYEEKNCDNERDVDDDCYLHRCLRPDISVNSSLWRLVDLVFVIRSLVVIRDQMSVSMDHYGCSSALRFIECKVYSGQKFFDLNDQLVSRAGSRVTERHVCSDWHSIHQPHLILTKGLVLIGGPPQGCDEQRHDRHLDHEGSEFLQGGFSRWRGGSHTPLICRRSCRSPVFFPDF